MKDDISFKILFICLIVSLFGLVATTIGVLTMNSKLDRISSKIVSLRESNENTQQSIRDLKTQIKSLDERLTNVGLKAESATRGSDLVLNAVGAIGREMEKLKP